MARSGIERKKNHPIEKSRRSVKGDRGKVFGASTPRKTARAKPVPIRSKRSPCRAVNPQPMLPVGHRRPYRLGLGTENPSPVLWHIH